MPLGWGTIKSKIFNYYEYFDRIQENWNILKTTFEVHNFAPIYVEKKIKPVMKNSIYLCLGG